jgi:hypothetical protein
MEKIENPQTVYFHDDGVIVIETEGGAHSASHNGEKWVHNYVNAKSAVRVGALDPKKYGKETVMRMLRGEEPFPDVVSPYTDIWFDLDELQKISNDNGVETIFKVDGNTVSCLAQITWEALAMCALADCARSGSQPNKLAMMPWGELDKQAQDNYKAAALEMLKFLASATGNRIEVTDAVANPPWREFFPLSDPAPDGHEAHMLHQIVSCPPLPRA